MYKRLIPFLGIFLSVVAIAAPVKLKIWMTGETPERLQVLTELMDNDLTPRTGISAEFTVLPWTDSDNKFILAAASGESPDVG